jgi:hypothetical protein
MSFLLLWAVFGVIGYFIGSQKGRPMEGVVLGLLLGPIGWLVVRFGPDFRTAQDKTKAVERSARIRVAKDGQDLGPIDLPAIKLHLRSGHLTWQDYYYDEDAADWVALASCPLLSSYGQALSEQPVS